MDSATRHRIETMLPLLNEKQRRLYLATEAKNIGHGGLKAIHNLTGTSMTTIIKGQKELNTNPKQNNNQQIRKTGGGRKPITQKYNTLKAELEKIFKNNTAENPEHFVLWTTKSLRNLEQLLQEKGLKISHDTIGNVLKDMGYSLQQNQKMLQHNNHILIEIPNSNT